MLEQAHALRRRSLGATTNGNASNNTTTNSSSSTSAAPSDLPVGFDDMALLANATVALINDAHTYMPDLTLSLAASELAVVCVYAASVMLGLQALRVHADGSGIWRAFWPNVARETLTLQATAILKLVAQPPTVQPLELSAVAEAQQQEARGANDDDKAIGDEAALDRLAGDETAEVTRPEPDASPRTRRSMQMPPQHKDGERRRRIGEEVRDGDDGRG